MKKRTESQEKLQRIATKRQDAAKSRPKGRRNHARHPRKIFGRLEIFAPNKLSFFNDDYLPFMNFIDNIKKHTIDKEKIIINLTNIDEVKASALLVLYANIEQIQKKQNSKTAIKTTKCSNKKVSVAFAKFGIWKLTGESSRRPTYSDISGHELEIGTASADRSRGNGNEQLRNIIRFTKNAIQSSNLEDDGDKAFAAITESVSNVGQHAYDVDYFDSGFEGYLKNWWIIVHRIQNQLFIAVYDMGAGIPRTLSGKPWINKFINELNQISEKLSFSVTTDATMIKAAVEYGRSRFRVDNRGKGLTDAKEFVEANPEGNLIIYSGSGSYSFASKTEKEETESLKRYFPGTLLQWNLTLEAET